MDYRSGRVAKQMIIRPVRVHNVNIAAVIIVIRPVFIRVKNRLFVKRQRFEIKYLISEECQGTDIGRDELPFVGA